MKDKELEKILKAFANKRRIAIVRYLKRIEKASVGDIANEIRLSFKATSKHLLILFAADILEKEQINLTMLYQVSKDSNSVVIKLLSIL